jgi:death-on-curing protein
MKSSEPRFLTLAEILYLHEESLARYGGAPGIREPGLIESALGSAQNAFWYGRADIFEIAAAYAFHVAEAQAFLDGNKRTAVAAAIVCLRMNGQSVPKDDGSVYQAMMAVAEKSSDKSGLAVVLRTLIEKQI